MPKCGIAGLYSNSLLAFKGTFVLFSMVASSAYIPTHGVGGSIFSTPSPALYYLDF